MIEMYPSFYPTGYDFPFPPVSFPPPPPSPSLSPSSPAPLPLQCNGGSAAAPPDGEDRIYFQNVIAPTFVPTHETEWSTGLFSCFAGDPDHCILTAICPCVVAGQISEIVNEGKTSCVEGTLLCLILNTLCCCTCIYTCHTRSKMRHRYLLKGTNSSDFMTHLHCMYCALCQEYRELYRLGFDPSIGWFENMERDRRAVAVFRITPPTTEEGMQR
ncbi:hypothetical protein M9H77_10125 [Catharanthus roseus]|uniref:Uncharacterized protein n=1 Tax=Catharanthus roseus TaxID=4058 RepID=A0ACC0C2K0_CATRO|nr:hypothetical protein M9H77_10125 [Catharanthus roseus]